jgi:glycosyltransferase involved in cell wall biosynthesis
VTVFSSDTIRNKKIVFFTAETVPSSAGGGRNAFAFARFFARNGAKTSIVCLNYNNKFPQTNCIDGVSIRRIRYYNTSPFHKILSIPGLIIQYLFEIRKSEILMVYGDYLPAYSLIMFVGLLLNKKVIFRSTLIGDDDLKSIKEKSGILWMYRRYIFSRIDLYFAINKYFEQEWVSIFKNKIPVFTSIQGVDNLIFNSAIRVYRQKMSDDFTILSCGIHTYRKGYSLLFETLSKLDFSFKYIVVGQHTRNPFRNSSEAEISEMQQLCELGKSLLGDRIEFIDSTENVVDFYLKADVFLHGAIQEGTPNVVLEAMATGLPVIMRELPGLKDVFVSGSNVELFGDQQVLLDKLKLIYENPNHAKAIGTKASTTIENNYSFDQIAGKIIETLYRA